MKINLNNSFLCIMAILLFHSSIIKFNYSSYGNLINLILGIIVFLYLLSKHKIILKKKYLKVNILIIIYSIIALFSSMLNNFYNLDGTMLYILKFLNLFLFFEYTGELNKNKKIIKIFFWFLLFYNLLTIFMMNETPYLAYYHNYQYPFYASKFSLSYYFMITYVLYLYAYKESIKKRIVPKAIFIGLCGLSISMAIRVDCVTGIIGNIMLFIMFIIPFKKLKHTIKNNKKIIIIMIICCFLLILFYDVLMKVPVINNIIVNTFERNTTLSGRNVVYQNIPNYLFSLKGLTFGYSYDGSRRIFQEVMFISTDHYAYDAQNALLEIWMYFGLIGSLVFLALTKAIYTESDNYTNKNIDEIYILAFVFILLGMVEITYSFPIFLMLAIINSDCKTCTEGEIFYDKKSNKKDPI